MEYVVLGLLYIRVMTIYELNAAFKQGISQFYSASYGSLQVAVKKLLASGFIDSEEQVDNGRQKKLYQITAGGREAFKKWMLEGYSQNNKLEVTLLSKLFFLGLIEADEERVSMIEEMVSAVQEAYETIAATELMISKIVAEQVDLPLLHYQHKTLLYGRDAHLMALDWFKVLLKEEQTRSLKL